VTERAGFEALRGCDVVFGCTDDHGGRAVLARLAYWYLIPVIDMGVVIGSADGEISGIWGRVTVATPGEPCLICRGEVDPDRMRDERLDPDERQRRAQEGYARGLDEPDPAVIAYTTLVAASAVGDLLQRLFGFGHPNLPGKQLLRIGDHAIGLPGATPRAGHFCADRSQWGRADREPPLGVLWA
jgi:hypothetical protein